MSTTTNPREADATAPTTTLADLQTWYRNAVKTHYRAGGHGKADHNERRAYELKTLIKHAAGVDAIPELKDCLDNGIFNGPGSV